MSATIPTDSGPPAAILQYNELLGVEVPLPALQRGWLHSRELVMPWNTEALAEKLGPGCWFSHLCRLKVEAERDTPNPPTFPRMRVFALAGFWPSGGFIELQCSHSNPLEDHPRSTLCVYAATPAAADALIAELFAGYRHDTSKVTRQPRIGLLNHSDGDISVERIAITTEQTVPRAEVDLYYGANTTAWLDAWTRSLTERRYGLTVLTGAPGTGKTTLIRSLAHWLAASHVFYFMPAARFSRVESGEFVTFWADENRNSKLRKVLILEDAESVLLRRSDDNREKVGTLLNLTDGMLGDALGLHIVCTLNSDLSDLDPALLRPGRLVAHRDFELLTAEQARALALHLGVPVPRGDRVSLAEFFNQPDSPSSARPGTPRRAMGFHAALAELTAQS